MFYIGSVLTSLAVVEMVMAGVLVTFWKLRVNAPGLPEMACAMAFSCIGALLAGYGTANAMPSVAFVGLQCFVIAILLTARAMRRLQGLTPVFHMELTTLLICMVGDAYFLFIANNINAVTVLHSVAYTLVCGVTARHLFSETGRALKPGCRVLGIMFGAFAIASIIRTVVRLITDIPLPLDTEGVSVDFLYALIGIAVSIGWSLGFLWTSFSVTEYRLRATNEKLNHFSGAVAHDLNTPLNAIIGYLEAADHLPENAQGQKAQFIATAREAALRMNRFIHHLLEQSRTGDLAPEPERINTAACIAEAVSSLQSKLDALDAEIRVENLPSVMANAFQMTRVFQNLFDNAIKYRVADRPLRIKVSFTQSDGWVYLSVHDNGLGIAKSAQAKIFRQYARGEEIDGILGYGLGLSECRRIVESFDGRIDVESEPGNGSTFIIKLLAEK